MGGASIEDWFGSAVIGRLVGEAGTLLGAKGDLHQKMGDLLVRLLFTLQEIEALIGSAERGLIRDPRQLILLRPLKTTLYDAEDVLDELQGKILSAKMDGDKKVRRFFQKQGMKMWCISSYFMNFNSSVSFRHDLRNLKKLVGELESISHAASNLMIYIDAHPEKEMAGYRETSSYIMREKIVVGRELERQMVIEILLSSGGEPKSRDKGRVGSSSGRIFDVLPLVGMGGVGKTTLAQLVYNDDRVKEHFDTRLWCYVSHDFDIKRILMSLWRILSEDLHVNISDISMETITKELKLALSNKKFFIVFDDVWQSTIRYWEELHDILACGAKGSKVVVTTRDESVARIVGTMSPIMVNTLSEEECWVIIKNLAFGDWHEKQEEWEELQQTGMQICEKAAGLPLAAKVLGALLRNRLAENSWRALLAAKWWELDFSSVGILPALKLSYQQLNANLRECFAYCSIFPRGHEFEKQKLVQMWRAQGYIKFDARKGAKAGDIWNTLEDIGSQWFDELKFGCLFEPAEESRYVMHDLIRELAISVSLDDCFIVEDGSENIPHSVRHLAVMTDQLGALKEIRKFERLRTILFFGNYNSHELSKILEDIFTNLKNLRVLDLSSTAIEEVPNAIGGLSHLRYLDMSSAKIERLPTSFWRLYRLQVLYLQGCDFQELPKGMDCLQINPPNRHSLSTRTITEDDNETEIRALDSSLVAGT